MLSFKSLDGRDIIRASGVLTGIHVTKKKGCVHVRVCDCVIVCSISEDGTVETEYVEQLLQFSSASHHTVSLACE